MSLLLDALKRAEEAKRAKLSVESASGISDAPAMPPATPDAEMTSLSGANKSTAPPEFRLEDYKEVIPAKTAVPSLPAARPAPSDAGRSVEFALERIADAPLGERQVPGGPASVVSGVNPALQLRLEGTRGDAAHTREIARSVFSAKQPSGPVEGTRKKWLFPAIAVMLLAVGGGGWYVWNEVNRVSRPGSANLAIRPSPSPVSPLPPAQPATAQPGEPRQEEKTAVSAAPAEPPLPPLLPPPAEQAALPKLAPRSPAFASIPLTEREALARSLKEAPASKEAPLELKLARSFERPAVNADLVDAYAALRQADYPRARALYAKSIQAEPLNPDAHLGMATAVARGGDPILAARHFRQVLAIDPRNGAALAGLLSVRDTKSPSLEGELKTLVDRHPETSSLRFSLGNLYASERRWVEAQQAYFEAFRLESDNADYTYNLAVSLDHLKQPKLAMDYYQMALATRAKAGGGFDPAAVTRRIKELTADSPGN